MRNIELIMKTRKDFLEYAKRKNMSKVTTNMMLRGVFYEFKGVEHLIGGFCGLIWNGEEWIEKKHNKIRTI